MRSTSRVIRMFDRCTDMFGNPLPPDLHRKTSRFLADPGPEIWNDIAHIVITETGITIWQAVCAYNSSFPSNAQTCNGRTVWSIVSTPLEVAKAIKEII